METSLETLRSTFLEKKEILENAKIQLKKEFIGIDSIIDEVVDVVSSWYTLNFLQDKPLIIIKGLSCKKFKVYHELTTSTTSSIIESIPINSFFNWIFAFSKISFFSKKVLLNVSNDVSILMFLMIMIQKSGVGTPRSGWVEKSIKHLLKLKIH